MESRGFFEVGVSVPLWWILRNCSVCFFRFLCLRQENKEIPLTPFGKGECRVEIPLEKGDTGGFFELTISTELRFYTGMFE